MIEKYKVRASDLPGFTDRPKDMVLLGLQKLFRVRSDWHWEPQEDQTQIMIVDKYALDLEKVESVPTVAASRGTLRWLETDINQMQDEHWTTGAKKFSDIFVCPFSIGCYAREGLEAEGIANLVFGFFTFFREWFRQQGAHEVRGVTLGEESVVKRDSGPELSMVPVGINMWFRESWVLTQSAERLENILDPVR
jgi:hypothetical protein